MNKGREGKFFSEILAVRHLDRIRRRKDIKFFFEEQLESAPMLMG